MALEAWFGIAHCFILVGTQETFPSPFLCAVFRGFTEFEGVAGIASDLPDMGDKPLSNTGNVTVYPPLLFACFPIGD